MKFLKFTFIFLFALMMQTKQINAQASINITGGPTSGCGAFVGTYTVAISNSTFTDVNITGGTLSGFAFTGTTGLTIIPTTTRVRIISPTFFFNRLTRRHSGTLTLLITWGASGNRNITALATNPFGNAFDDLPISSPAITQLTGPNGLICSSTTSVNYIASGPTGGTTRLWTATSTGAPVTITNPTGIGTSITGLTPNNMYSINCTIFCGGVSVDQASTWVVTGNPTPCYGLVSSDEVQEAIAIEAKEEINSVHYYQTEDGIIQINTLEERDIGAQKLSAINVYPNPASKDAMVNITLPATIGEYQIQVVNLQGKVVYATTTTDTNFELATSQWSTGMYNIMIKSDELTATRKLIVK